MKKKVIWVNFALASCLILLLLYQNCGSNQPNSGVKGSGYPGMPFGPGPNPSSSSPYSTKSKSDPNTPSGPDLFGIRNIKAKPGEEHYVFFNINKLRDMGQKCHPDKSITTPLARQRLTSYFPAKLIDLETDEEINCDGAQIPNYFNEGVEEKRVKVRREYYYKGMKYEGDLDISITDMTFLNQGNEKNFTPLNSMGMSEMDTIHFDKTERGDHLFYINQFEGGTPKIHVYVACRFILSFEGSDLIGMVKLKEVVKNHLKNMEKIAELAKQNGTQPIDEACELPDGEE